jgi:hypothetical protein
MAVITKSEAQVVRQALGPIDPISHIRRIVNEKKQKRLRFIPAEVQPL